MFRVPLFPGSRLLFFPALRQRDGAPIMTRMDQAKPSGRVVFQGRKVELRLVDLPLAHGGTAQRELVIHPGAVVILALTDAEEVVMIRNVRFAVGQELWELPAGTLEPSEPPQECAFRELREETGYQAERLEPLGRFYSSPGFCTELLYAFVARGLNNVGQDLEADERIRVEVLPLQRVRQMMLDGEIVDSKTLAALGLYLLKRNG
jgi:ADP-ribose pyrophosphatase